MHLILWRHAEAEIGTGNDLIRQLTPKGHRQAQIASEHIKRLLPKHACVCVSQATRSQQTAHYLQRETIVLPELNPEIYAPTLPPLLQHYGDDEWIVWVGHQDWIGDLGGFLLTGVWAEQGVWIKKGAFWHLEIIRIDGAMRVKLRDVVSG